MRILDRQKKFEGDLNSVQNAALQWLMLDQMKEEMEIRKVDWEMMALAANPATNKALLDHLHQSQTDDGFLTPEEETKIDWVTPESSEEVDEILSIFNQVNTAKNS